jgi:trans-2,3-dihydro-3-hydroxyanthranilate isomerase
VFPDATAIPDPLLQPIAREFNYAETVFAYPPADPRHTARLRIFTPARELRFAGHPTVGAAHVLAAVRGIPLTPQGVPMVLEEGVGPVRVRVRGTTGYPEFAQLSVAQLPVYGPEPPAPPLLAELLSLSPGDLSGQLPARNVSCGTPFLLVPLRDTAALAKARPNLEAFERVLKGQFSDMVMMFAPAGTGTDELRARMFAPSAGILEDAATGSAAVCVGGYFADRDSRQSGTLRINIHQGQEMGRPSRMEVEADKADGRITDVRVGGPCVRVCDGTLHLNW